MTSEELAKIKKRLTAWLTAVDLPPAIEDIESLLAVVAEQQKEIDHRDKIIHDLVEESDAARKAIELLKENEKLKKYIEQLKTERTETGTRPLPTATFETMLKEPWNIY